MRVAGNDLVEAVDHADEGLAEIIAVHTYRTQQRTVRRSFDAPLNTIASHKNTFLNQLYASFDGTSGPSVLTSCRDGSLDPSA
jgi:hypothetical protein